MSKTEHLSRRAFLGTSAASLALASAAAVTASAAMPGDGGDILDLWRRWAALSDERCALEKEIRHLLHAMPADVDDIPRVDVIGGLRFYTLEDMDEALARIPGEMAAAARAADGLSPGVEMKMLTIIEQEITASRPVLAAKIAKREAWRESVGLNALEDRRDAMDIETWEMAEVIAGTPSISPPALLAKLDVHADTQGAGLADPENLEFMHLRLIMAELEAATGLKATAPARRRMYAEM